MEIIYSLLCSSNVAEQKKRSQGIECTSSFFHKTKINVVDELEKQQTAI